MQIALFEPEASLLLWTASAMTSLWALKTSRPFLVVFLLFPFLPTTKRKSRECVKTHTQSATKKKCPT